MNMGVYNFITSIYKKLLCVWKSYKQTRELRIFEDSRKRGNIDNFWWVQ
jgi:hypothetical protein